MGFDFFFVTPQTRRIVAVDSPEIRVGSTDWSAR
jgi:hypothetical protein